MDISIVVPLFNEEESLPELEAWIERVISEHRFSSEGLSLEEITENQQPYTPALP